MEQEESNKQKEQIIKKLGEPLYDGYGKALNESAVRIEAIKKERFKSAIEARDRKRLEKLGNKIKPNNKPMKVASYLIKPEWVEGFTENEQRIIEQWIKDVEQDSEKIAASLGYSIKEVNKLLNSTSFKILYKHVAEALMDTATISAILVLKEEMVYGANPNTRSGAAQAFLKSAGMLQIDNTEDKQGANKLDPETEKRLKELGDKLRQSGKE